MQFGSAFWQRDELADTAGYRLADRLEALARVVMYGDGLVFIDDTDRERIQQAAAMCRGYERAMAREREQDQ